MESFPKQFNNIVVIPVYNEFDCVQKILPSVLHESHRCTSPLHNSSAAPYPSDALWVLVINANEKSDQDVFDSNLALMDYFKKNHKLIWQNQHLTLYENFLIIDKTTQLIPYKQGVGLARKIGCDIALKLIVDGKIISPWIYSTDADVILPEDYFSRIDTNVGCAVAHQAAVRCSAPYKHSAMIFPFKHTTDLHVIEKHDHNLSQKTAIKRYEDSLYQYVNGLTFAESPYAFHTIGSTIAIHSDAYAKVRGFPKRNAGEDFYILNKLAKVGKVLSLDGHPILLSSRTSDRTPFGTGAAVEKLMNIDKVFEQKLEYSDGLFIKLKSWLSTMNAITLTIDINELSLETDIREAIFSLGGFEAIPRLQQNATTEAQLNKSLHDWFDGFRTLKFIHLLRDREFGALRPSG